MVDTQHAGKAQDGVVHNALDYVKYIISKDGEAPPLVQALQKGNIPEASKMLERLSAIQDPTLKSLIHRNLSRLRETYPDVAEHLQLPTPLAFGAEQNQSKAPEPQAGPDRDITG